MNRFRLHPYYLRQEELHIPEFRCKKAETAELLEYAYYEALNVMFNVCCVCDYDAGGKPVFVAGGEYNNAWTRDGSYNNLAAGSLLSPGVAKNTFSLLVAPDEGMVNGGVWGLRFTDMQFWDKVIWIIAAHHHSLINQDRDFLAESAAVAVKTIAYQEAHYYRNEFGLFRGPGFFLDSIGAWPKDYCKERIKQTGNSCVLDYPELLQNMTLSTNCLYVESYRCAAKMLDALNRDAALAAQYREKADTLAENIRQRFFAPSETGIPAYFIDGMGKENNGKPVFFQEGCGIGFALLFGIPNKEQAQAVFDHIHHEPNGLPCIWPNLWNDYVGNGQLGSTHGGYHTPCNIVIHPQVNGIWILGCAEYGQTELIQSEIENLFRLVKENQGVYENYHARTGNPKLTGLQAKKHQNWSATACLSAIHHAVFGLRCCETGLSFSPNLPPEWGEMTLSGIHFRDMDLDLILRGGGNKISRFLLDGKTHAPRLAEDVAGHHEITIEL